jgi:hypothetical protein
LADGKLKFYSINVDEPGNEHYWDDYKLDSKSLVIVLFRNGKQVKWENLKDVWLLLNDEAAFHNYVKDNTAEYLKEIGALS